MTDTKIIDPETWVHAVAVLEHARRRGLDPVEVLHRRGLLWTPAVEHRVRVEALEFLQEELLSWRPAEFLRMLYSPDHSATPTDMYHSIAKWLELHIIALKADK